jgi:ubiquitin carboxyl-terminal hydrolase 5/13
MNIKKTAKANIDMPTKVTKLAIGKPGGVDPETDRFDTSVTVFCNKCKKYLDVQHAKIKPTVDSILLAQSANDQSMVAEWELELNPCEHTLTLD